MNTMNVKILNPNVFSLLHSLESMNLIRIENNKVDYTGDTNSELQSIERGFADFQQGKVISHTQARKRYEKWL